MELPASANCQQKIWLQRTFLSMILDLHQLQPGKLPVFYFLNNPDHIAHQQRFAEYFLCGKSPDSI
jgi:hypothetical protein